MLQKTSFARPVKYEIDSDISIDPNNADTYFWIKSKNRYDFLFQVWINIEMGVYKEIYKEVYLNFWRIRHTVLGGDVNNTEEYC